MVRAIFALREGRDEQQVGRTDNIYYRSPATEEIARWTDQDTMTCYTLYWRRGEGWYILAEEVVELAEEAMHAFCQAIAASAYGKLWRW